MSRLRDSWLDLISRCFCSLRILYALYWSMPWEPVKHDGKYGASLLVSSRAVWVGSCEVEP